MTLLIDGDWLIYSACCASEHDIRWDEWINTLHCEQVDIRDHIVNKLGFWSDLTGDKEIVMCFSDYPTFRHQLSQDYKATRMGKRKPLGLRDARVWAEQRYETRTMTGLEADDVMAILLTSGAYWDPIMVSIDKDMRTVPGRLLIDDEVVMTSKEEANYNWMMQTLTGDSSDNYPGLKGCGPVKAAKVLEGAEGLTDMWTRVCDAYKKGGCTFADLLLNARLARILRHGDYDLSSGTVRLWEPATDPEISYG
ncbi:hypothetical protein EBT31_06570 [bacterium]|nr:hypothetical protein [bacterium]